MAIPAPARPRTEVARSRADALRAWGEALGLAWARRCRADLLEEQRPAAGGWPGTMSEARAVVANRLASERKVFALEFPNDAEREQLARVAYGSARRDWLEHRCKDDDL
jgi:hypothetical protein